MLLDAIAGVYKMQSGTVTGNADVIYINQNTYFSEKLKGKDLLTFAYLLDGNSKSQETFYSFVSESTSGFQMDEIRMILEKKWGVLSGGERKYVYSLMGLSVSKQWYILDEPFAYLDKEKKNILIHVIKRRLAEGKNIIITSHEQMEEMEALEPYTIWIDAWV